MAEVWPQDMTRSADELIRPDADTTMLSPAEGACGDGTAVIVVVCSAVDHVKQREAIRNSWAKRSKMPAGARVVFFLGRSKNDTHQAEIKEESLAHGDVLQENFLDSYSNLTVKSLMLLKWFSNSCDRVPYVLKTDDDVFVNVKNLLDLVVANTKSNLLMGSLICGAVPIRDPYNKYYCPKYMFEEKVYPNYLSGTGYLMSRSTAAVLLEASSTVPVFHLEDIYLTGIVARAVGLRPEDSYQFSYLKAHLKPCLYAQIITSHHLNPEEMVSMAKKARTVKHCKKLKKEHLRRYSPGKCKWP